MLKKNVGGEEIICSEEEEREIREKWAINDKIQKESIKNIQKKQDLIDTYGDLYECIDVLFKHLNLKRNS